MRRYVAFRLGLCRPPFTPVEIKLSLQTTFMRDRTLHIKITVSIDYYLPSEIHIISYGDVNLIRVTCMDGNTTVIISPVYAIIVQKYPLVVKNSELMICAITQLISRVHGFPCNRWTVLYPRRPKQMITYEILSTIFQQVPVHSDHAKDPRGQCTQRSTIYL